MGAVAIGARRRVAALALVFAALAACAPMGGVFSGAMRWERAPADAPYTNDDLIRSFAEIALKTEFAVSPGRPFAMSEAVPLHRWIGPVRYRLVGADVEAELEADDHMGRLAHLTGLEVARAEAVEDANFHILYVPPALRGALVERLRGQGLKGPALEIVKVWRERSDHPCIGQVFASERPATLNFAYVLIKTELTPAFLRACLIEETTQAMGLFNDSPAARPSIFNDDQEFAELTEHDEYLLRALYDARLKPGMTEDEAMPLVREIIAELRPER